VQTFLAKEVGGVAPKERGYDWLIALVGDSVKFLLLLDCFVGQGISLALVNRIRQ
jgi:hypothetical protein